MADKKPKHGDYEVGFMKPPRSTQFQKGRSGNPNGRPKGKTNFQTDLTRALDEFVTIVVNGRRKKVTKRAAICQQLTNRSLTGDTAALRLLLPLLSQLQASGEGEFVLDPELERSLLKITLDRLATVDGEKPEQVQPKDQKPEEVQS